MKKLLIAGTAVLTLMSAGAASAQSRAEVRQDRQELRSDQRYNQSRGELRADRQELRQDRRALRQQRRWARGQRLPANYYRGNQYYVSDYGRYGLRAPPRGYRWYHTGNDYVLAAAATGLIASVIAATR